MRPLPCHLPCARTPAGAIASQAGIVLLLAELHGVVLHHLGLDLGLLFDTWARVRVRTGVRAASHKKLANLRGITPDHLNAMTSNFDDIPPTRCHTQAPAFRFV